MSVRVDTSLTVIIMGPQGAGKGTQGKRIEEKYGLPHLSTGDLIRAEVKQKTPYGRIFGALKNDGKLVPDDIMIEYLQTKATQRGKLLDGFPRTIAQAEALDRLSRPRYVLNLQLSDNVAKERIKARRACNQCERVYSLAELPNDSCRCEKCKIPLFQRQDDQDLAVVSRRLSEYHLWTEPLLEFYAPRGIVTNINANQEKDKVTKDLFAVLDRTIVNLRY